MTESTLIKHSASRLVIEALEAGALSGETRGPSRMLVELSDIRAWRFFEAAPEDFLEQYASDFVIADAHLAPCFYERALDFLQSRPQARLTMRARFCRRTLLEAMKAAAARGISVEARHFSSRRALAARIELSQSLPIESSGQSPEGCSTNIALREVVCTAASQTEGGGAQHFSDIYGAGPGLSHDQAQRFSAQAWTNFFKHMWFEDLAPALRLRDRSSFFSYMKALARQTSQGLNWAQIAASSSISAPTARDWTRHLESIGLCELIEPLRAPAPRRAKLRPKLYWTTPGLALWLADSMLSPSEEFAAALVENALFLALKDALPQARFYHFIDTNYITAPIVAEIDGIKTAFYLAHNDREMMHAVKSLKSLAKAKIVSRQAQILFWDYGDPTRLRTEELSG